MRQRGFTLLEVMVALAIFAYIAAVAMATISNSGLLSGEGKRARQLRLLAERKLGEILAFEGYYDQAGEPNGSFDSYKEFGDEFHDWTWQYDLRDVVVFGISNQQDAEYLFGAPSEEDVQAAQTSSAAQPGQPGQAAKKGEPQLLRELTLRVLAPAEEGGQDSVEIVTFVPQVKAKAAAGQPK